jgi:plastocyanin
MKRLGVSMLLVGGMWMFSAWLGTTNVSADDDSNKVALVDDCDPTDPAWAPTGGCLRKKGDVNTGEFFAFLTSPLSAAVIGHPAWAIAPSYVKLKEGNKLKVTNEGGRTHTFTEVVNYGGGFVPVLNNPGLTPALECSNPAGLNVMAPGARLEIKNLAPGNHKFICCIHPWMRADIKVKAKGSGDTND